jgi:hypothetical protein
MDPIAAKGLIVVEGPHDVAIVGRLLKPHSLKRIEVLADLDPFWRPLIPTTFPHEGYLNRPVPVPVVFQSPTHSVAVYAAGGDAQLVHRVEAVLQKPTIQASMLAGIGILLDADQKRSVTLRFADIVHALAALDQGLTIPDGPGLVAGKQPRVGIMVLPDNADQGALEDLLLECAQRAYPTLLTGAEQFVAGIDKDAPIFQGRDMDGFRTANGPNKAKVASIAAILKPGRALANTLQDNRWLDGATLALPRVKALAHFLDTVLGIA